MSMINYMSLSSGFPTRSDTNLTQEEMAQEMMTNGSVLKEKIDFSILKLHFQIFVIHSSALRTIFETLKRQFVQYF